MAPPDEPENGEAEETALDDWHQAIANTAYFLWEQDGSPEGLADIYWQRAEEKHLRQRAYDIWLREGSPHGREGDIWQRARKALDK
ncbi:DUF2934 domain-containing protein [Devosia algicola]|uniref:DUF2934 domain-containing protein n=1 Tax=Devosia algicola TaxID=3026418 RepID=A0ABY7YNE1_9HYPH|nr:DUF2934 domain-containing protein [Devosia algicola]WDR02831.1 DUF2934 domain-containing protein [Devosia algicola]